jgi:hypothetical protein
MVRLVNEEHILDWRELVRAMPDSAAPGSHPSPLIREGETARIIPDRRCVSGVLSLCVQRIETC